MMNVLRKLLVLGLTVFILIEPAVADDGDYFVVVNQTSLELVVHAIYGVGVPRDIIARRIPFTDKIITFQDRECLRTSIKDLIEWGVFSSSNYGIVAGYNCPLDEKCKFNSAKIIMKGSKKARKFVLYPLSQDKVKTICKTIKTLGK